jgi:hypothetical protein
MKLRTRTSGIKKKIARSKPNKMNPEAIFRKLASLIASLLACLIKMSPLVTADKITPDNSQTKISNQYP